MQMAEITFMGPRSNGITIRDDADRAAEVAEPEPKLDDAMEADVDFARQLQGKLDAEQARGGANNRSAACIAASACSFCLHGVSMMFCLTAQHLLWREHPHRASRTVAA